MKSYQKKERRFFVLALVCALCSTIFAVTLQFFKGNVLDAAAEGQTQNAVHGGLLLISFILCEVLCYFLYKRLSARFVAGCTRRLKQDVFESILGRDYVAYKTCPQGEYIAKFSNETDTIRDRYFQMLPMFWEILFTIVLVSTALFVLDWRIAIVTIGLLTTPLYIPKIIEKKLQNAQTAYIQSVEDCLSQVNDWLSGFEIIKNFSIEKQILRRFRSVNDTAMEKFLRDAQLGAVAQLITTLISYLSYFIVLVCSTWLVLNGDFSAGDFFVAIGMIDQLSYPLISLAGITRQLLAIKPACAAMEAFLRFPKKPDVDHAIETFRSGIRFENVSFSYDGQRPVLDHFNLTIQKGKRYLLRGPSGCGKTTAINLLLGYYNTSQGRITIDDVPLQDAGGTYSFISVVCQEAVVFHDTLRNNLTMYSEIPDSHLIQVLDNVGLHRLANIQALESMVTEQGANFSGGEKKRICLARALLRNTDLLILDEPLANLDDSTAQRIEDLLLSIEGKTIIVVSHQFTEEKVSCFDGVVTFNTGK